MFIDTKKDGKTISIYFHLLFLFSSLSLLLLPFFCLFVSRCVSFHCVNSSCSILPEFLRNKARSKRKYWIPFPVVAYIIKTLQLPLNPYYRWSSRIWQSASHLWDDTLSCCKKLIWLELFFWRWNSETSLIDNYSIDIHCRLSG